MTMKNFLNLIINPQPLVVLRDPAEVVEQERTQEEKQATSIAAVERLKLMLGPEGLEPKLIEEALPPDFHTNSNSSDPESSKH